MELFYQERGNKGAPTIVFLHGGGVAGWMWEKQAEFMKDYHCLIPDLPEHGRSTDIGPLTIPDSTERVARLIEEKANGGKAHIIGHSLGAKIAIDLLAKRPELVTSAVVASALFRPMWLLKATHKPYIYRMSAGMMKSKAILRYQVKNFHFPDNTYFENCMRDFAALSADRLYREYDCVYQNLKLPSGLEKANVPVLVVAGDREFKAMKLSVKDIVEAMPNASGVYVVKGDHTYPWSMHEGFNRLIYSWITERKAFCDIIKPV